MEIWTFGSIESVQYTPDTTRRSLTVAEHLPPEDQTKLWHWFDDRRRTGWDAEMDRDFSPGGLGIFPLEEAKADVAAGRTRPRAANNLPASARISSA